MNINILYNQEIDEFTNDLSLQMRLKRYLTNHFYPAYTIAMLAPVYLVGGAIRDLIYAKHPKDLDIVVIGKEHLEWVLEVFNKFNINHKFLLLYHILYIPCGASLPAFSYILSF